MNNTPAEQAFIDAALALAAESGTHAGMLPIPGTPPQLYATFGEAEDLLRYGRYKLPAAQPAGLSIAKIVKDSILGNSHPCDDGYLMFISEREVLDVCNQVELALAAAPAPKLEAR